MYTLQYLDLALSPAVRKFRQRRPPANPTAAKCVLSRPQVVAVAVVAVAVAVAVVAAHPEKTKPASPET